MTPGSLSKRIVIDRLLWMERMIGEIRALPLEDKQTFFADSRNIWTAESCLRRALEAVFDLGRHILAKGFGTGTTEYKEIAIQLVYQGVFSKQNGDVLLLMAGYRNRLVHFYHEVSPEELYQICTSQLGDLEKIADAYRLWMKQNAGLFDEAI